MLGNVSFFNDEQKTRLCEPRVVTPSGMTISSREVDQVKQLFGITVKFVVGISIDFNFEP